MPDARWNDPREYDDGDRDDGRPRVYGELDRDDHDPRDSLMHDLDLPRGEERELVVNRDHVYELNGEDSRTLAVVGAFGAVPEQDLDAEHDTLRHLRDEGLIEAVDLGGDERGLSLTKEGRDLLDSHSLGPDGRTQQTLHAGVSRPERSGMIRINTRRQEEARLRDEHPDLEIRRVILEQDLKREYQDFLQDHNRNRSDSDGRPGRSEDERTNARHVWRWQARAARTRRILRCPRARRMCVSAAGPVWPICSRIGRSQSGLPTASAAASVLADAGTPAV